MSFFDSLKDFFNGKRRSKVRRYPLGWGGYSASAFAISNNVYADVIVASILDIISNALKGTNWSTTSSSSRDFVCFVDFFERDYDKVVNSLFFKGYAPVVRDADGFFRLTERTEGADYTFVSSDYSRYSKSTADLLRPFLSYLDDILNASNTSIKRLGVMAFLMPKSDTYGNGLTEEELDAEEKRLQTDYGILDNQKIIKVTAKDYSLGVLNIGGANLQLDSRLQSVIKTITGKIGVPYELVPAAIIGNPNQTGVYQLEAMKRLYVLVSSYAEMFVLFAKSFGLTVEFDFPAAPKDYETQGEELTAKILANIKEAETAGYITHEEAVEKYIAKISSFE